jgi:hypothetical protein
VCASCRSSSTLASAILRALPRVPLRHYVLTLPDPLRRDLAAHPRRLDEIVARFMRTLRQRYERRAGEAGEAEARRHGGGVAWVHRRDGAFELDLHIHGLVLDGVFASRDGAPARFVATESEPRDRELLDIAREVSCAARCPMPRGRSRPVVDAVRHRGGPARSGPPPPMAASHDGWRVSAGRSIGPSERDDVARVIRYLTRAEIDPRAFAGRGNTRVVKLRRPLRDGTTAVELDAAACARRIASIARAPTRPSLSFHGVLAPRALLRPSTRPQQLAWRGEPWTMRATSIAEPARPASATASRFATPPPCPKCGAPQEVQSVRWLAQPSGTLTDKK